MLDFEELWVNFVDKEFEAFHKRRKYNSDTNDKYFSGTLINYKHFDLPIKFGSSSLNDKGKFHQLFNNRFKDSFSDLNIFTESYYPLLYYPKKIKRYRFDDKKQNRRVKYKKRDIYYSGHFDSLRLRFWNLIINTEYERILKDSNFNSCILAYRKHDPAKSNIDFAFDAFKKITEFKKCDILCLDISKFFDNISHQELKKNLINVLDFKDSHQTNKLTNFHYKVFNYLTKFNYVDKKDLDSIGFDHKNRICSPKEFREVVRKQGLIKSNPKLAEGKGIPQGTAASATLANISMLQFDQKIFDLVNSLGGYYLRYSDDLLIVGQFENVDQLLSIITSELNVIGLELNNKLDIFSYEKNGSRGRVTKSNLPAKVQYLGFEFDGFNIYLRSSSLSKYHGRMKRGINKAIREAYGRRGKGKKVFRNKLRRKFLTSQDNNFVNYALRAQNRKQSFGEVKIKAQISKRYKIFSRELEKRQTKFKKSGRFRKK